MMCYSHPQYPVNWLPPYGTGRFVAGDGRRGREEVSPGADTGNRIYVSSSTVGMQITNTKPSLSLNCVI